MNTIHAHIFETGDKGGHIIIIETRVHTPDAIHVALEYPLINRARIFQGRFKLVRTTQLIERCNRRHEFHGAGRTHQLALTEAVDAGICLQVPNHDTHLRSFKHFALEEFV